MKCGFIAVTSAALCLVILGFVIVGRTDVSQLPTHTAWVIAGCGLAWIAIRGGFEPRRRLVALAVPPVVAGLALGFMAPQQCRPINAAMLPALLVIAGTALLTLDNSPRRQFLFGHAVVAIASLLVAQRNLATAITIGLTALVLLKTAGSPSRHLLAGAMSAMTALCVYLLQDANTLRRIHFAIHRDPDDEVALPLMLQAIREGGWLGSDTREGMLYRYAPREAINEYVGVHIIEQWGMIAFLAVLVGFGLLVFGAISSYRGAQDLPRRLTSAGAACLIAWPVLLHTLVLFDIFPIRSPALPLVSHDGPMLAASGIALGLITASRRMT